MTNTKKTTPRYFLSTTVLCFVIFLVVILYTMRGPIGQNNIEAGDFAANSLLILQAKQKLLLVGNYSRVGFNHPGPAILYVLAAGEIIFFNLLKMVKSPFSGQLIAVAVYNAFWIGLIWRVLYFVVRRLDVAVASLLTFLMLTALLDHQVFNGIWFPHLYFFPFCAVLFSSCVLIKGHLRSLPTFAVACGVLFNGHVSFIPVLSFLALLLFGYSLWVYGIKSPSLAASLLDRKNLPVIILSCAIVLFSFLPLIILTATQYPGPLAFYASFGGSHKPNSIGESIQFVGVYWGGTAAMIAGMLGSAMILRLRYFRTEVLVETRDAVAVVAASTAAILFYARYGVDLLNQVYIGEYYYSVPAFLGCFSLVILVAETKDRIGFYRNIFIAILSAFVLFSNIDRPTSYESDYNRPGSLDVYNALVASKPSGTILLNLDDGQDWESLWSTIVGAQVLTKRHEQAEFCINRGWNILFTKEAKCPPDKLSSAERYVVTAKSLSQRPKEAGEIDVAGLRFIRWAPRVLADLDMTTVSKSPTIFDDYLLLTGWSSVETASGFVWSVGKEAKLLVPVGPNFSGEVSLDLTAFLPAANSTQNLQLSDDRGDVSAFQFSQADNRKLVKLHISQQSHDFVTLILRINTPYSPHASGLSGDNRQLGVALYGLKIVSAGQ